MATPGERDNTNIEKLFYLIRKSPRRWWLYSGLLLAPFLCVILLIRPVLSAPLLPKSHPRQHKALDNLLAAAAKSWSAQDFAAVRASCLKAMAMPGAPPQFQSYAHLRLAQSYLAETNPAAAKTEYEKNPVGPRGVYDEAKRFAEALTLAYHRAHSLDTRIARIFNTYGPRMRPHDGRVISNFIVQALQGKDLTIYGGGTQTRSFCYVSDLVEGIIRLLIHYPESEKPAQGATNIIHHPVNLGGSPPVNTTVSMGNLSSRKWVLKKCTVKMNPTASRASSLWMMVATLIIEPGSSRVKNSGNHSNNPVVPMTATPQNTAK